MYSCSMPSFFSVAVEYMLRKSDPMRKGLAVMDHGERVPQRECMCCGGDYPYEHLSEPMQAMQKCHMCRITVGVAEEEE